MVSSHFTKAFPVPDELFFDVDKSRFQISNECSALSDEELTEVRKKCQYYNQIYNAYLHGLRD